MMQQSDPTYYYVFKPRSELFWFVVVAASTVLMQTLVEFDPDAILDWHTWLIGIGAAMIRAGAGAFLAYLVRHGTIYSED